MSGTREKAVVVTGASTGIGRATALRLDRAGWCVYAGVRRATDGEDLQRSASARLRPLLLDVTDEGGIARAAARVLADRSAGGLQGLVNNAGVAVGGVLEFLDVGLLRHQLEVNLIGVVAVTKAFLPAIRRGGGRVVNISSDSGLLSTPFLAPYCASKFGLEAVSDALRRELRPWGIEVVLVEPGAIATPIWEKGRPQTRDLRETLPPEAARLYGAILDRVESLLDKQAAGAIPADAVAAVVERGLTVRRPRLRYPVGRDARMVRWLTRLLPARAVDAVVAAMIARA